MKDYFRSGEKRSGLSALMMVIALLITGALAKHGAAVPLFHLTH
jgi:hypothetical protein